MSILSCLYFLITLTIIVFIHEFGHYFVAKKCGVKIVEFSIGFGKLLFQKKDKSKTQWSVRLLPLGGYVKMFGDDNASSFGGYSDNPTEDELKYALIYKHPFKKILVALAGPFMNFVLSFILFFAVFLFYGKPIIEPIIGKVMSGSIAEKSGILANDNIIEINGNKIKTFNDIRFNMDYYANKNKEITIKRGDKIIKLNVKIGKNDTFGIFSKTSSKFEKVGFIKSIQYGIYEIYNISSKTVQIFFNMVIHQKGLNNIGGPITIAKESAKAGKNGLSSFLYFIALISTSLGIINLLPIPMLDGGHICINTIELITRKKFSNFAYKIFVYVGFVVIALLMGIGFFNDIFIH